MKIGDQFIIWEVGGIEDGSVYCAERFSGSVADIIGAKAKFAIATVAKLGQLKLQTEYDDEAEKG